MANIHINNIKSEQKVETIKNIKNIKFQLETLSCPTCVGKIETALNKQDGVEKATVLFNSSKVKVAFDETKVKTDELAGVIEKLGYPVIA